MRAFMRALVMALLVAAILPPRHAGAAGAAGDPRTAPLALLEQGDIGGFAAEFAALADGRPGIVDAGLAEGIGKACRKNPPADAAALRYALERQALDSGGGLHFALAVLLERGSCMPRSLRRALHWYESAAQNGVEGARARADAIRKDAAEEPFAEGWDTTPGIQACLDRGYAMGGCNGRASEYWEARLAEAWPGALKACRRSGAPAGCRRNLEDLRRTWENFLKEMGAAYMVDSYDKGTFGPLIAGGFIWKELEKMAGIFWNLAHRRPGMRFFEAEAGSSDEDREEFAPGFDACISKARRMGGARGVKAETDCCGRALAHWDRKLNAAYARAMKQCDRVGRRHFADLLPTNERTGKRYTAAEFRGELRAMQRLWISWRDLMAKVAQSDAFFGDTPQGRLEAARFLANETAKQTELLASFGDE